MADVTFFTASQSTVYHRHRDCPAIRSGRPTGNVWPIEEHASEQEAAAREPMGKEPGPRKPCRLCGTRP